MTWSMFLGELVGTALLILIGNGVVANVLYKKTGGSKGGALMICMGWGIAVLTGALAAQAIGSPAQLNPAVTIGMLTGGQFQGTSAGIAGQFFGLIGGQIIGAVIGQLMVTTLYWEHSKNEDAETIRWTHCTDTTHPGKFLRSGVAEFIGTLILVLSIFFIFVIGKDVKNSLNPAIGGMMVAVIVTGIGVSHGVTGWAINPVRDLVPRIMYQFTPYKNKTDANWKYGIIPVAAPLLGGVVAGGLAKLLVLVQNN